MTAMLEGLCTIFSGLLLFSTKGKELGISWLLFAVFLGVFGSYEILHHSHVFFEQYILVHSASYLIFGWTGFLCGLLLFDGLIDIIAFNTVAVMAYVILSSAVQLTPARVWFCSKAVISALIGSLGASILHRWPLHTLHTTTVLLGAFLVAAGTQVLVQGSDSLISSVTECAEAAWKAEEDDRRVCYPTYILWPVFIVVASSVRAKRSERGLEAIEESLIQREARADSWLPKLPAGFAGLHKAIKILIFRAIPGCLQGCYNFLAMARRVTERE